MNVRNFMLSALMATSSTGVLGREPKVNEHFDAVQARTGQAPFTSLENLPPSKISGWPPSVDVFASGSQKHLGWQFPNTIADTYPDALLDQLHQSSTTSLPEAHANIVQEDGFWNVNDQQQIPVSTMDSPYKLDQKGRVVPNNCPNMWNKGENPKNLHVLLISGESGNEIERESFRNIVHAIKSRLQNTYLIPSEQFHILHSPTPLKIKRTLQTLGAEAEQNDQAQFLISYTGHGMTDDDLHHTQNTLNKVEGDAVGVLRTGTQWVPEGRLAKIVTEALPANSKIMLIIDACKSGAFVALKNFLKPRI